MRYLKMTLPAIILIIVLVVALKVYPDLAKSYQERQSEAATAQESEETSVEAVIQSSETEENSASAEQSIEESLSLAESSAEEQPAKDSSEDAQSESDSADSSADISGETELNSAAAETALTNTAPDFAIKDSFGIDNKLSDHFGKPLVVNFWATWCPYCVQELPIFNEYAKEYSGDIDFMIVDLADGYRETIEMAKKYVADYGYSFPVYFDTTGGSTYAYGITGIPVTLFIDADGNLMTQHVGAIDEDTLARNIQALGIELK